MLAKNIEVQFDKEEGDNLIFKTASGQEISLPKELLANYDLPKGKLYMSLSSQASDNESAEAKQVLNDLLESDTD